uniref:Uncharacterized protein n=1 Tax=Anguilla anguilla TaxID=7936 RepID=A0A0E9SQG6_ANGAN
MCANSLFSSTLFCDINEKLDDTKSRTKIRLSKMNYIIKMC